MLNFSNKTKKHRSSRLKKLKIDPKSVSGALASRQKVSAQVARAGSRGGELAFTVESRIGPRRSFGLTPGELLNHK